MRFDWKNTIVIIATVAGVFIPIIIWQYDLKSKSIDIKLVSSTELQSPVTASMPELKLTINGEAIILPIFSLIEITNTGNKSVLASDFESPLEINLNTDSKLLRVTLVATEPVDLKPSIEIKNQKIKIQPLLLNPNDKLKLSVLSSGALPTFTPSARIAGIGSIGLNQEFEIVTKKVKVTMQGILSILGFLSVIPLYIVCWNSNLNFTFTGQVTAFSSAALIGLSYIAYTDFLQLIFEINTRNYFYYLFLFILIFLEIILLLMMKKWFLAQKNIS